MDEKEIGIVSENFSKLLTSLGDYLISVGEMEKSNPNFNDFIDKMKSDPSYFDFVIKSLPPELSNKLLHLFVRMINLQLSAKDADNLKGEEKIKLGNNLKGLGNEFLDIYTKVKIYTPLLKEVETNDKLRIE